MRFDLTIVNEVHIKENGTTYNISKHEVEIERLTDSVSVDRFIHAISYIIQHYEGAIDQEQIIDQEETRLAISLHNIIFAEDIALKRSRLDDAYKIFGDYENKPKNIKINYMLEKDFDPSVTIKLDGKRYSLVFTKNGTYMFNPPYDIIKVGPRVKKLKGTVIDCEYLLYYDNILKDIAISNVYGFDILFFKGEDVRKLDFNKRLALLETIPDYIEKLYGIEYHTKVYFKGDNFYDRTKRAFEDINTNDTYGKYGLVDGLIFQPKHWYKNNHTYKWKDAKDLTIDFLFEPMNTAQIVTTVGMSPDDSEIHHGKIFWLKMGDKTGNIVFSGSQSHHYGGYVVLESEIFDGQNLTNKIVECYWDSERENFLPRLIREDKDRPNYQRTVLDIWEDIMNPIPQATMEGNTLQLMRKYHNGRKLAMLTKEFRENSTIIDIGSGRGGDLQKWNKIKMKTVYAIDPNTKNLAELQRRLRENTIKTDVKVMNHGAEKYSIISKELKKNGDLEKLNGIVSFASLTFFPKERKTYDDILKTIDLLPLGGKFIGFVFDGEKVKGLLESARLKEGIDEDEVAEYDTGAYTIRQASEFDDNVIGNEIEIDIKDQTSMVKAQTEWLFYFEPFRQSLEDMGFKLISSGFLNNGDKYDVLPESSKVFSKVNKSFVFQRISGTTRTLLEEEEGSILPSSSDEILPEEENIPSGDEGITNDDLVEDITSEKENILFSQYSDIKIDSVTSLPGNKYGEDLYYTGIPQDPSNFIHAILRAISPEYYEMDQDQRSEYAANIRRSIAGKLTKKMFKDLHGGELSKCLYKPYLKSHSLKDAVNMAYSEFKETLMDTEKWTGENFLLELSSIILGVDIYVLIYSQGKTDSVPPGDETLSVSRKFSSVCDKLYTNSKSIVLVTFDDKHHHIVSRKQTKNTYYVYNSSSKFIQALREDICV